MKKILLLTLILTLLPLAMSAGDNYLIHASDGTSSINGTDICVDIYGTPSCLSDATAGAGINTIVAGSGLFGGGSGSTVTLNVSADTCGGTDVSSYNGIGFDCVAQTGGSGEGKAGDGTYLYNDSTTIFFNDTFAGTNLAVNSSDHWDDLDTFNTTQMEDDGGQLHILLSWFTSVWNSIFATKDTDDLTEGSSNLYDNQSWTEVVADGKYALIGAGGNSSFNESLTDILYVPYTGANSNVIIGEYLVSSLAVATEGIGGRTASVALNFSEDYVVKPTQDNIMDLGESESGKFKNLYLGGNATADYFKGDGSLLTGISGGNSSFNQSLTDNLYADISITGDNSSWNQSLANTLYADISVTGDNSSWNESHADTLYATIDEPLWTANETTVARVGDCPAGEFVQNTTTGGVECATPGGAGGGTVTNVATDDTYLTGGPITSTGTITFNATLAGTSLEVNESTWWAGISGWVSGWFQQDGNNINFNETKLNETGDSRYVNIDGDNMTGSLAITDKLAVGTSINGNIAHFYEETVGIIRLSLENPSSAAGFVVGSTFQLLGNGDGYASIGYTNTGSTIMGGLFSDAMNIYNRGYGSTLFVNDGAEDFIWYSDPLDAHNYSAFNNEIMRLNGTSGNLNINKNITASYFTGDGSQLTGISGGNSSFNQSLTDDRYINIAGDQTDSNQILINTTFSNVSAIPAINIASFTFRNINDTGASSVSALNDEGFGSSVFSFGSNAILSNISGLARYGGDLSILVGTPGNNIEMKIVNATGGIEDTLIIQSDGNVLLKNRLLFEDTNKSIYSATVNGGSGLFFLANETLSGGETPFIFVARNSTGSEIKPLILQNGKNNSGSYWRNSEIIGGDMGIEDENNLTNCLFMLDLWGQHVHVGCDTDDTGADVIVQDDIQLGGTIFAEGGIWAESIADFIMNGNEMSVFNGSIHPATPVTFEKGFTEGDSVTIFTSDFSGNINPFVNIQSDSSNWKAVADVLCNEGQCANSNGIGGTGNIVMQTNKSTSNVNETTLSFVYSLVALTGADDFVVTVNNNIGSGDVQIFTDSGTDTLVSQVIALPSSMDDASILTINFNCGATAANRDCFVDDVKLNGTATDTTLINVSSFDSVINMGDGTLATDGYPVRGIFYHAENDTIVIRGDVTQTLISEIDLNVTTSITLQGETINFWDNITQFVTNMLLTDGSRGLTANWNQGAFNFTNTNSWFLGKVDWSTIQNIFSGSTTDDLTEGSSNLYDNSSWNESHANTLYADISVTGDNSSWNESYADTLYYDLGNSFGYYNSTDFDITDYFTSSQILGFSYYNSTDFDIGDYSTTSEANALYAPINYGDDWNKTYADGLYADISVTGDNSSWNETYADTKYSTTDTTYSAGNGISESSEVFTVAGNTALTQDADGLSVTADGITDTELEYNTGQALTTTSNPTFNNVTVADCIIGGNGAELCFV